MKTKNLISIGFLVILIVLMSLIYKDQKEGFQGYQNDPYYTPNPYMMPMPMPQVDDHQIHNNTPYPETPKIDGLTSIPNLDTSTMDRLYQLAKDIKEVKSNNVPQESLDKLSQEIVREIRGLQLAVESQNKINSSLSESGNQDVVDSLSDGSLIQRETIKEKQLLQNYRIQKMEDRIRNLRKTYQDFLARKNQAHYPKIPIYSSCVVSEPQDGIVDSDTQSENKVGNNVTQTGSTLPASSMAYNPFRDISKSTSNQGKNQTPTLEKVLNMLSQGQDINLNFDIKTPSQ